MRAISQSQRIDNSMAFFKSPCLRLAKVAARLRSSKILVIRIFFRPMSAGQDSQRSCFREAPADMSVKIVTEEFQPPGQ
jgi:hypothetical protein